MTPLTHEDQNGAHHLFGPEDKKNMLIVVESNWWWHGEVYVKQHTNART